MSYVKKQKTNVMINAVLPILVLGASLFLLVSLVAYGIPPAKLPKLMQVSQYLSNLPLAIMIVAGVFLSVWLFKSKKIDAKILIPYFYGVFLLITSLLINSTNGFLLSNETCVESAGVNCMEVLGANFLKFQISAFAIASILYFCMVIVYLLVKNKK